MAAAGVYEAGLCVTDKSIVLRGAGPQSTLINYGDGANIISIGKTFLSHSLITFTPITSAAIKGATTITVSSVPTGVAASTFIVISQTNPNDIDGNPLVQIGGYQVEVMVIVEDDEARALSGGRNEQVGDLGSPVLAPFGEPVMHGRCSVKYLLVHGEEGPGPSRLAYCYVITWAR